MNKYNHTEIEKKWQKQWAEKKLYHVDEASDKEKFYGLIEFPYPSGNLHVGHWYAFSVFDIFIRAKRMQGYNVLYPIGFDAFGLPAENAAIKRNLNPREWTLSNIETMKNQIMSMGASFDWSREVVTCSPEYYKWTQWLFLELFKNGLAYQGETKVNWCPECKTVLANEQVVGGVCERCESEVVQQDMLQWMFRITRYAEALHHDLDEVEWPKEIKESQRNWIGKSEGAHIPFMINGREVNVFTTRPDTLFGVTYMVLAPEHALVSELKDEIENYSEVEEYQLQALKKTEIERMAVSKDKTGVKLEGVVAVNPVNGERIPVYIADYVMAHYGTGAIMAVPAHDERDNAFAKKYGIEIKVVISGGDDEGVFAGEGELINSGEFDGLTSEEAKQKITEKAGGKMTTNYKLRDWVISRQRYWGCPIPIIHCKDCGPVAVKEDELPVVLPEIDNYLPREDGKSPLAKAESWMNVACPTCGSPAERETDTLDTFVDSSWYYFRYTDPQNEKEFASRELMKHWMPVDLYSGGAEHTTMHLLYARFFCKALKDVGLVEWSEPFAMRMNRGLIMGPDKRKMSKSKGNVIDPDVEVEKVGSDTVRMYLAFIGPYNETGSFPWDPNGVVGVRRFLERVWAMFSEKPRGELAENSDEEMERIVHATIKKVTEDVEVLKFNTAISSLMMCLNYFEKHNDSLTRETVSVFLRLLAPFAPHIAEELWSVYGNEQGSVHLAPWPVFDETKLAFDTVKIVVQINGKVRGDFEISTDATKEDLEKKALSMDRIQPWIEGKKIKKTIVIPGKIVNVVIE